MTKSQGARIRAMSVVWAMLAATLLAACGDSGAHAIRLGLNSWPGYEFAWLASTKGFYAQEGVDVRIVEFSSLADARRAYERGQIDAIATTVVEVVQIRNDSSRSPQIVQVVDCSSGADVILAKPELADCAAMRGKRVGVELGSISAYVLLRALQQHGLAMEHVQVVSKDQLSMFDAFRKGELDAVVTYPPTSVRLQRECAAKTLFSSVSIPGEVVDVIAVEESVVSARPNEVRAMLRAFWRAQRYADAEPDTAHEMMARREGITRDEFRAALTEGICLLGESDQRDYLPRGKLEPIVLRVRELLRSFATVQDVDRSGGSISTVALEGGSGQ